MNGIKQSIQSVYKSHRAVSILLSKTIVVLLMTCMGFGYAQFVHAWFSSDSSYLTVFCLVVSAEAAYTHSKAAHMEGQEKLIFRASELLTLFILFKIFLLIRGGSATIITEIASWQVDFLANFFNGPLIAGLLIFAPSWLITTLLAQEIDALHDREQDSSWDELGLVQNALHYIRGRITGYVFGIGAFVLFLAVGSRLNLRSYLPVFQGRSNLAIPIANVLIYFVLALVLLSLTQFALLRTRWLWKKTPVAPHLARRWAIYGIGFFSALAILVFFLPTDYSMGFFETIAYAIGLLGYVFRFVIFLIMLPLTLCLQIFKVQNSLDTSAPEPPPGQMPQAAPGAGPDPFWQFVQAALFWVSLVAVVIFALSQYFRANSVLWNRLAKLPVLKWGIKAWSWIWSWLKGANKAITSVVAAGLRRLRPPSSILRSAQRRIRNPGGLTAREQVIQLYLTLIEIARDNGQGRSETQTPYQYSQNLITTNPDVTPEVLDVTDAFVEARYSRHAIEPAIVPTLRTEWERIRDHFRRKDQ
jgi:hypothetical protein